MKSGQAKVHNAANGSLTLDNLRFRMLMPETIIRVLSNLRTNEFAPRLFAVLAVILGITWAFVMPALGVADEHRHFLRAYGVSQGEWIGSAATAVPQSLSALESASLKNTIFDGQDHYQVLAPSLRKQWEQPLLVHQTLPRANPAANLYSFVPYLPQAVAIAFARWAGMPAIGLMFAARLANLAAYVGLTSFALFLMPDFQLLLLAIALMPMSLHQAASASADGLTLATTFLFVAYILRLAFDPSIHQLTWKQAGMLALLAIVNALCKFNLFALALLFLIPGGRFGSVRRQALMLAGISLAAICSAGAWQASNQRNIHEFALSRQGRNIDTVANFRFVRQHPVRFALAMAKTVRHPRELLKQFVGTFGWLNWPLRYRVTLGYIALLFLLGTQRHVLIRPFGLRDRTLLIGTFAATMLALDILIWTFETNADALRQAAGGEISLGFQGRYLIPLAMLPFLFFNGLIRPLPIWMLSIGCLGSVLFANMMGFRTVLTAVQP